MVIDDWAQTPAYDMMVKGWSQNRAFLTELNQFTLKRFAQNLEERRHFDWKMRQKEFEKSKDMRSTITKPKPKGYFSDSSDEEILLRKQEKEQVMAQTPIEDLAHDEVITELSKHTIEEPEIDYLIRLLKREETKNFDEISSIYMNAKHTFHTLMCRLGQM